MAALASGLREFFFSDVGRATGTITPGAGTDVETQALLHLVELAGGQMQDRADSVARAAAAGGHGRLHGDGRGRLTLPAAVPLGLEDHHPAVPRRPGWRPGPAYDGSRRRETTAW
ncbi:hypothetical protein DY245_05290 [Streptomyces inhibens]|uniref:Uncharacterized protein n=1 Tax=Streptomyces inhibens TaxID=2293571 RepID=A0A371Q988_STRIH|nr:hypothetical protein DY245_05290 [Streptomyces inhibens]